MKCKLIINSSFRDDDDDLIVQALVVNSVLSTLLFYFSKAAAAVPLTGAFGMIPACDNIRLTVSDGCAPTDNQYLILSMFKPTCLCESLEGIGS
jgi:hypothetical protein